MNRDLFLAILAMDAYNRGYAQGIAELDDFGSIGKATVAQQSNTRPDSAEFQSNFYAVAYDWNGEKVISYRGTDDLIKDANTGYALGGGSTDLVLGVFTASRVHTQLCDYR